MSHLGARYESESPTNGPRRRLRVIAEQLANGRDLPIRIHPEVRTALETGHAVVALESTIITHGVKQSTQQLPGIQDMQCSIHISNWASRVDPQSQRRPTILSGGQAPNLTSMPYPANHQSAVAVEAAVRDAGAVPATIAVVNGVANVGLTPEQLQHVAQVGSDARKCSKRDLAAAVAQRATGGTTVAATMWLAAVAGIRVFVTGGLGGVHRGAERTWDVSADLMELGKSPVAVVCAGIKSVLDIPKSLELLETQGVPVATLGSDYFPAFYTPKSSCKTPLRVDSAAEAAKLVAASFQLGLGSGVVIGVPIPAISAPDGELIEAAIQDSLAAANAAGIEGPQVTPFVLQGIIDRTDGKSLDSNIALILNNARVGAHIAVALTAPS